MARATRRQQQRQQRQKRKAKRYILRGNRFKALGDRYRWRQKKKAAKKQYKKAIAAYAAGLKEKVEDSELTAVLYCNRAAAHYHLSQYIHVQYAASTTTSTPYSLDEVIVYKLAHMLQSVVYGVYY